MRFFLYFSLFYLLIGEPYSIDLFCPWNFRYIKMFGQIIQMFVEFFHPLLMCKRCFLHDSFLLLKQKKK